MGEPFCCLPGNAAGVIRDPESLKKQAKPLDSGLRRFWLGPGFRRGGRRGEFIIYARRNNWLAGRARSNGRSGGLSLLPGGEGALCALPHRAPQ